MEQLLRQLDDRGVQVYRRTDGQGTIYRHHPEHAISPAARPSGERFAEGRSAAYMAEYGKLFGIADQARQLRAEGAEEAGKDRSVVRFQQVHENVPVLGGELNVQVDVRTACWWPRVRCCRISPLTPNRA